MNILLFGANGQLGRELQGTLSSLGSVIALGREGKDELCGDVSNAGNIEKSVRSVQPSLIVNASAYTAVDKAESETEITYAVNGMAPDVMSREAKKLDALLVHYSTDYVFGGSGFIPWTEEDEPYPLNVYGSSKLQGENFIRSSGCRHLIFRTSWVYSAHGENFLKKILRLAQERDTLSIIDDQIGAPTSTSLLANKTLLAIQSTMAEPGLEGLYHLTAQGAVSWYQYALYIFSCAKTSGLSLKLAPGAVKPVSSNEFSTPAKRPLNSCLNCGKFINAFKTTLPVWKDDVENVVGKLLKSS